MFTELLAFTYHYENVTLWSDSQVCRFLNVHHCIMQSILTIDWLNIQSMIPCHTFFRFQVCLFFNIWQFKTEYYHCNDMVRYHSLFCSQICSFHNIYVCLHMAGPNFVFLRTLTNVYSILLWYRTFWLLTNWTFRTWYILTLSLIPRFVLICHIILLFTCEF